jgi:hypothetical protein
MTAILDIPCHAEGTQPGFTLSARARALAQLRDAGEALYAAAVTGEDFARADAARALAVGSYASAEDYAREAAQWRDGERCTRTWRSFGRGWWR